MTPSADLSGEDENRSHMRHRPFSVASHTGQVPGNSNLGRTCVFSHNPCPCHALSRHCPRFPAVESPLVLPNNSFSPLYSMLYGTYYYSSLFICKNITKIFLCIAPDTETKPLTPANFFFIAIATSEAGQPPPYSNMWTLYCLTDMNQQSRPLPPPAPGPFPQATLYLSNPKDLQNSPKVTSPAYVMMDDSKKTSAPPFILVGSNVQEAQDWKPLPGHAVVSQSDTLKRYAAVQVPIAVPADQKFQKHLPTPQNVSPPTSGQDGPRPQSPVFFSVAFPVEDVAKKGSGSGDKRTPFGSYGIAGEITVTSASVRRAET